MSLFHAYLFVLFGLHSEFDIAACVVYVGDAYTTDRHKKQWVFVTDGSIHGLHSREPLESLLAIGFCSPFSDGDMLAPVNYNLAGSTVSSKWVLG